MERGAPVSCNYDSRCTEFTRDAEVFAILVAIVSKVFGVAAGHQMAAVVSCKICPVGIYHGEYVVRIELLFEVVSLG